MNDNLKKAIDFMKSGGYTCVLCKGETVYSSVQRGVKPLLDWIDSGLDLRGFSAADKVVGKAAAFLYVLLGVEEVYAPVMSEGAVSTLIKNGIQPTCDKTVGNIINRAGDGFCPMESAVGDIILPSEALIAIRAKLAEMQGKHWEPNRNTKA